MHPADWIVVGWTFPGVKPCVCLISLMLGRLLLGMVAARLERFEVSVCLMLEYRPAGGAISAVDSQCPLPYVAGVVCWLHGLLQVSPCNSGDAQSLGNDMPSIDAQHAWRHFLLEGSFCLRGLFVC